MVEIVVAEEVATDGDDEADCAPEGVVDSECCDPSST